MLVFIIISSPSHCCQFAIILSLSMPWHSSCIVLILSSCLCYRHVIFIVMSSFCPCHAARSSLPGFDLALWLLTRSLVAPITGPRMSGTLQPCSKDYGSVFVHVCVHMCARASRFCLCVCVCACRNVKRRTHASSHPHTQHIHQQIHKKAVPPQPRAFGRAPARHTPASGDANLLC